MIDNSRYERNLEKVNKAYKKDHDLIINNLNRFLDIMPPTYVSLLTYFYKISTNEEFKAQSQSIKLEVSKYQVIEMIYKGMMFFKENIGVKDGRKARPIIKRDSIAKEVDKRFLQNGIRALSVSEYQRTHNSSRSRFLGIPDDYSE